MRTYNGPMNSDLADSMIKCDPQGPTIVQITKLYHTSDAQQFRAFGRVMSGTIRRGQSVKVLGEGYSLEDEEDMVSAVVEELMIDESRCVLTLFLPVFATHGQIQRRHRLRWCGKLGSLVGSRRFHLQNSHYCRYGHRGGSVHLQTDPPHDYIDPESCCRAYSTFRASEDAGWSAEDQQILSPHHD